MTSWDSWGAIKEGGAVRFGMQRLNVALTTRAVTVGRREHPGIERARCRTQESRDDARQGRPHDANTRLRAIRLGSNVTLCQSVDCTAARGRQANTDGRALADGAFDLKNTAVLLCEGLCQRQAEPSAFLPALTRGVDLTIGLKRFWNVLGTHPNAAVRDREDKPLAPAVFRKHAHCAARVRELHCVGQQIYDDLSEAQRITVQENSCARLYVERQGDAILLGARGNEFEA